MDLWYSILPRNLQFCNCCIKSKKHETPSWIFSKVFTCMNNRRIYWLETFWKLVATILNGETTMNNNTHCITATPIRLNCLFHKNPVQEGLADSQFKFLFNGARNVFTGCYFFLISVVWEVFRRTSTLPRPRYSWCAKCITAVKLAHPKECWNIKQTRQKSGTCWKSLRKLKNSRCIVCLVRSNDLFTIWPFY